MQFDMEINANEFKEKKLKVLANVPLKVVIRDDSGQLLEEFITKPSQIMVIIQNGHNWNIVSNFTILFRREYL